MAAKLPRLSTWAAIAAPVFFLLAAGDLALRSREALREAERQEFWSAHPADKAAYFEADYRAKAAGVEKAASEGALDAPSARTRLSELAAERDLQLSASSAKMAYIWYLTAAEKFPAPFNPWAARARERLPAALAAWQAELAAAGVKAEPWMLR